MPGSTAATRSASEGPSIPATGAAQRPAARVGRGARRRFRAGLRLVALLNDDTTEVGAVHLGAVYVADGEPTGRHRETDKLSGSFVEAADGRGRRRPARDVEPPRLRVFLYAPPETMPIIGQPGVVPSTARPGGHAPTGALRGGLMAAKILVVDDDANVQRLLQYTLKQEGYDVVVASDGAEGFRLWGAEAPDRSFSTSCCEARRLSRSRPRSVRGGQRQPRPGSSCSPPSGGRAEGPRSARRRRRLPHQAVPPGRAAGRIKSLLARFAPRESLLPAAARARPRLLRRQGRWGPRRSRSTRRSLSTASSAGRSRWSTAISSSATTVFLDLGSTQEHRRPGHCAVDRCRPRSPGHGQARLWHRPPACAATPETAELVHPSTCRSSPTSCRRSTTTR